MKKAKIISLSLASIAITSSIATLPLITTSCGSETLNNIKNEFVLMENNAISLSPMLSDGTKLPVGADLIRTKNTNNYTYLTKTDTWGVHELNFLNFYINSGDQNDIFKKWVSKQKLSDLGFDQKLLSSPNYLDPITKRQLKLVVGIKDVNGTINYSINNDINIEQIIDKLDPTKEFDLFDTFKIIQFDNKKIETATTIEEFEAAFEDETTFDFKLKIKPNEI